MSMQPDKATLPMLLPIPVPAHFRIIAHRGASAYAPENTMAAFKLAHDMGVYEVELDTQLTVDGVIALCHDSTLARYGHGPQVVETLSWAQLASLDMGSWFSPYLFGGERMITLDQLFNEYQDRLTYHVEIKGKAPGLPAAVHHLIQERGLEDHCIITSFSYGALEAMRSLNDTIRLGWLVRGIDQETVEKATRLNLYQLCPFAGTVSSEAVDMARSAVQEVRAWGLLGETAQRQNVEVITLIHNVIHAGCDGMTINWPDWVKK